MLREANEKTNDNTYPEAITIYRKILEQWDQSWDAHYRLAKTLWQYAKKPEEAAEHMDRAIALNPGNTEAYYWGGRIYYDMKMAQKYRPYFQHYVQIEPDSYNAQDLVKRYSHLLQAGGQRPGQAPVPRDAGLKLDVRLVAVLVLGLLLVLRVRRAKQGR
ncbi:MAG: tetratricopeptide repeat protein [Parahaliea sp.]